MLFVFCQQKLDMAAVHIQKCRVGIKIAGRWSQFGVVVIPRSYKEQNLTGGFNWPLLDQVVTIPEVSLAQV